MCAIQKCSCSTLIANNFNHPSIDVCSQFFFIFASSFFLPKRPNLISAVFFCFCYSSIFFLRFFYALPPPPPREMRVKRHSTNEKIMEQFRVCVCNSKGISFLTSIKRAGNYFIDETCFVKFMLC